MAMHCTRMACSPCSMTPLDLAACLPLRQPLHPARPNGMQRLSPTTNTSYSLRIPTYRSLSPCRAPSPCRSPSPSSSPTHTSWFEPRSCLRRNNGGLKKRVCFADARGMALTAVRLFIPDVMSPPSSPCYSPLPSVVLRRFNTKQEPTKSAPPKLRLAFTQPSLDFKVFMARQKEMGLQLESCSVSVFCLSGRVRVSQAGTEQNVHVRMSFDSWRSHHDIPCTFQQRQRSLSLESDIYSFELSLPLNLDPIHGIEFCVTSRTGEVSKWDDNRGQNYRIQVEKDVSAEQEEVVQGSPKMSRYQPLPLLVHMTPVDVRSYADLPHLRALSHLGVEWGLCTVR
ncbi:protein phosphatase 1 regulatory subunit 3C isoform X2 [Eucyclogobius newberryi]|uniref:protein phosphatase 1 regulatory subunit 3C isoform X2 n=1 Tax=Eucyclogobius newberryi TaxID=166745 RepID=UPI003B5A5F72